MELVNVINILKPFNISANVIIIFGRFNLTKNNKAIILVINYITVRAVEKKWETVITIRTVYLVNKQKLETLFLNLHAGAM